MTFKTRMSVLALSTPVLAFVLVGGLMGTPSNAQTSGQQAYQHLRVFDDVVDLVLNNYVTEVEVDKVMLVTGDRESAESTVAVRSRSGGDLGAKTLEAFIADALLEVDKKQG